MALELFVPAVVEVLGLDKIADVDVPEQRSVGEQRASRRLSRARRARHQNVGPHPAAAGHRSRNGSRAISRPFLD